MKVRLRVGALVSSFTKILQQAHVELKIARSRPGSAIQHCPCTMRLPSGGENVAPVPIEDRIKAELPFVSHAVVIGDGQRFLAALLTLQSDWTGVDSETVAPSTGLGTSALQGERDV